MASAVATPHRINSSLSETSAHMPTLPHARDWLSSTRRSGAPRSQEPVASLDPVLAHSILRYLETLNQEDGITVICSLHFLDLVHRYATRVIGLKDGELVFDGLPTELTPEKFKEVYGEEAEVVTVSGEKLAA